jgi:hypothetical protein
MRDDVAALYVDPRGPYPKLVREWWDETRDASTYAGPWPVVAHPPCGPWGHLAHLDTSTDRSLAIAGVEAVRRWGGCLEHPTWSGVFDVLRMPRPGELPDAWGGVTVAVCQCDFGHVARKRSWIHIVGARSLPAMPPPREPTHWVSGGRHAANGPVPAGIKVCSPAQRRRTPVAFAEWLIEVASRSRPRV